MNDTQSVDAAHVIENQRLSPFLIGLVSMSALVAFLDGLDTNLISFAAPYMAGDFGLSRAQTGNLFSIHQLGALLGGFLFAYWGDIAGRRPALITAAAAFGCLTTAFAFADGYGPLLTLRFLNGLPLGGLLPLIWALNIEYAPKLYRATIVTLVMAGYSVGTALGGPLANALAPRFGWQSVFLFGGVGALLSALLLFWKIPESVRFLVNKSAHPSRILAALRRVDPRGAWSSDEHFLLGDEPPRTGRFRPAMLFQGGLARVTPLLWLAYAASSFAVFFLVNWTPILFESLGYSRDQAASAAALNSIAGTVGGLLLMRLTDRRGAGAITIMPAACALLLLLAGTIALGKAAFLALIAMIGFFLIGGHFGMHSVCGMFYPTDFRGNGAGWAASVAKLGSIAGPLAGGWALSSDVPIRSLFAWLAVVPLLFAFAIYRAGVASAEYRPQPAPGR